MDGGPPSVTVSLGDTVHLQCLHNGSGPDSTLNITWWRVLQGNATWPDIFWSHGEGPNGELTISTVNKSHMGMYRCQVEEKGPNSKVLNFRQSCGTYLRVRGEWQPWLGSGGLPSPPTAATLPGRWGTEPVPPPWAYPGPHCQISSSVEWGLQWSGVAGGGVAGLGGQGCGGRGQQRSEQHPSSQSHSPDLSWTWERAPRTTSSRPRASSCCSVLWYLGHCCCSG